MWKVKHRKYRKYRKRYFSQYPLRQRRAKYRVCGHLRGESSLPRCIVSTSLPLSTTRYRTTQRITTIPDPPYKCSSTASTPLTFTTPISVSFAAYLTLPPSSTIAYLAVLPPAAQPNCPLNFVSMSLRKRMLSSVTPEALAHALMTKGSLEATTATTSTPLARSSGSLAW